MLRTQKIVYGFVVFYVLFNIFIIGMIWYPPDKQGAVNSYVTPGVSTALIVFGIFYWVMFAKVTPALGYQIEDEEEGLFRLTPAHVILIALFPFKPKMRLTHIEIELADGTRWVTYKVCLSPPTSPIKKPVNQLLSTG